MLKRSTKPTYTVLSLGRARSQASRNPLLTFRLSNTIIWIRYNLKDLVGRDAGQRVGKSHLLPFGKKSELLDELQGKISNVVS